MKKTNLFFSILIAFLVFSINTSIVKAISTGVDGTIIVRWIDYGDLRNERPDEINLVVANPESSPIKHETVNLKAADATISVDPNDSAITEWKFTKRGFGDYFVSHEAPSRDFRLEYSYINDKNNNALTGYNYIDSMSNGYLRPTQESLSGTVLEKAGTLVITLVKDTLKTKNLIVTYNDCQARDSLIRGLDFAIKGGNVADPITQNAYYRFKISSTDTINGNGNVDTYTKSIMISDTDAYQSGNPKINYIFEEDTQNMKGRTVTYKIEGDNILVTVNYQAKTNVVPFEVEWHDNNNQLGLRPESLLIKAYDQNGELEKEINLLKSSNWTSDETLYENMKYSNGIPIVYSMELAPNDNYEYSVTKDGNSYKVIARLKGLVEDEVVTTDDVSKDNNEITSIDNSILENSTVNNPRTGDYIVIYITTFFLSFSGLIISFMPKMKASN